MKPNSKPIAFLSVVLVLAIASLACGIDLGLPTQAPPQVITVVVPPSAAPASNTPVPPPPSETPRPSDTPTFTPTATSTATPTVTATPTLALASFTVNQLSNCRTGPNTVYPIVKKVEAGQTVPIVGKSDHNWFALWWIVQVEGVDCWLWSELGSASGDTTRVLPREAPPTPTPIALPQACDSTPHYGPIKVGTWVYLGKHRVANGSANWNAAMDAFIDAHARVTELLGVDGQGCTIVRVNVDDGAWEWRVRDMLMW